MAHQWISNNLNISVQNEVGQAALPHSESGWQQARHCFKLSDDHYEIQVGALVAGCCGGPASPSQPAAGIDECQTGNLNWAPGQAAAVPAADSHSEAWLMICLTQSWQGLGGSQTRTAPRDTRPRPATRRRRGSRRDSRRDPGRPARRSGHISNALPCSVMICLVVWIGI